MPPPTAPPTLSSTLLLGVLTAAFLLPAALPLDDESEVMLTSGRYLILDLNILLVTIWKCLLFKPPYS